MKPSELHRLRVLSDPRIHPTEDITVFQVSSPNTDKDRYDSRLWLQVGDEVREMPNGKGLRSPRWSPNGSKLATLQSVPDDPDNKDSQKHAQAAVLDQPLSGGPARILTSYSLGVSHVQWSPDGKSLLVIANEYRKPWSELSAKDRTKQPRHLKSIPWRWDSAGTIDDRVSFLALVDVTGQRKDRKIDLDPDGNRPIISVSSVGWHASGSKLVCLASRVHAKKNRTEDFVLEVNLETGDVTEIHRDGYWTQVFYLNDEIMALGIQDAFDWPRPFSLWSFPSGGSPVNHLEGLDRMVDDARVDETSVFFLYEDCGKQFVGQWNGSDWNVITDEVPFCSAYDIRPSDRRLALVPTSATDPGELVLQKGHVLETVTELNHDFRNEVSLTKPEHFVCQPDGVDVDTWVFLPEGDKPVPVLLNIHGGPATQYGFGFFDEFQVYVAAGYGVVACNPRGSAGRGTDHLRAVRTEGWGKVDQADILGCLEEALKRFDRLDATRVGVMGGSYGGFMTAWLTAHTDQFKSAVVERGLVNWPSFAGTSDIGTTFPQMYLDENGFDSEMLKAKSPLTFASRTKTPTLVLHSEEDYRCPIEQAEQYFTALLENGTHAEFLRFPGESHELSRSGNPKHRVSRFESILEWHKPFLKP